MVGDKDHSDALFLVEMTDQFHHIPAGIGVQHGSGFIQHDAGCIGRNGTCNADSLLLSAGQTAGRYFALVEEPYRREAVLHSLTNFFGGNHLIFRTKGCVFFHTCADDLIIRVLKHHAHLLADLPQFFHISGILSVNPDGTFRREKKHIQMLRQGGFSAAVGA